MKDFFFKWIRSNIRFFKFALTGASGVLVNLGILFLLVEIAHMDKRIIAPVISLEASIINNFLINHAWTFRGSRNESHFSVKFLKFNLISLIGIGLNLLIYNLVLYSGIFKFLSAKDYIPSQLSAILVVMFWNYFMNTHWTWKE